MTKNDDSLRLTKVQYEILEALRDGGTMTIDRSNSSSLGTRAVSLQTRSFLTENRLVERRDKTKSVETSGNGFIISAKGLALLRQIAWLPQPTKREVPADEAGDERTLGLS